MEREPEYSGPRTVPQFDESAAYAGPINLRDEKGRSDKTYKAYICLLICFASKGVDIELVTDSTSEAFIATFRRITARRATPKHLYSDNATNFIGTQSVV
ncbi:hypothetical protein D910_12573 [Dendroctonus ponderosae]|uniref:Integrase catalytic domain-containing protein n=1 Tax=Dendroctonus ponderosae TaxID=77166 RepID=U4UQD0_DENPD|nr:hypothetical protein D910_12573 [Dendroctonus ponderosae]